MTRKFPITVTAQMRHGILWEARALLGGAKALAEDLGISYSTTIALINFRYSPGERWLQSHGERVELKLSEILARPVTLAEIFPPELCTETFQRLAKRIERTVEVDPERLLAAATPTALQPAPDDIVDAHELTDAIREALATLSPREEAVIKARFGLDGQCEQTLQEIGERYGVGRERIRTIEIRALKKLRHPSRSAPIKRLLRPTPDFSKHTVSPNE